MFLNADFSSKGLTRKSVTTIPRPFLPPSFFHPRQKLRGFRKIRPRRLPQENLCRSQAHRRGGKPRDLVLMLSSGEVRTIRERIDLDFAHSNKERFSPGEEVKVKLWTKNVQRPYWSRSSRSTHSTTTWAKAGRSIPQSNWTACPQPGSEP